MVSQEMGDGSRNCDRTSRLRNSYLLLCKGLDIGDDSLNEANVVLGNAQAVIGTRKLAAQIVYRCEKRLKPDWLILAAASELEDVKKSAEIFLTYLSSRNSVEIGSSDEEFCFLTTLIQRFAKKREDYARCLGTQMFLYVRERILATVIILNEVRTEDVSHLIKAAVKLFQTDDDQSILFELCMEQIPLAQLKAPFMIISILLSNKSSIEWITRCLCIVENFPDLALHQTHANSVAPLISCFVEKLTDNKPFQNALLKNLIHHKSGVRSNTIRCWLSRANSSPNVSSLFTSLLHQLTCKWDEITRTNLDDVWPPFAYETEEISCIDPAWKWEESEDVWWIRDRILCSYLALLKLFAQKFPQLQISEHCKTMIVRGLSWHLSEVRLLAFQMVSLANTDNKFIEHFLIVNAASTNGDLHSAVHKYAEKFSFSNEGELAWTSIKNLQTAAEQGSDECPVFVPDGLHDEFCLPSVSEIPAVVEEKLNIICQGTATCPSFPVMYARLDAANYHLRLYTKHLIMLMDALACPENTKEELKIVGSTLWKIITLCRLKAVVDRGCTQLENILSRNTSWAHTLFSLALEEMISSSSTVRTLCISRALWSCCATEASLFKTLWINIRRFISIDAHPQVLTRILKTLKLFVSKSECKLPADSLEELFWFCIDVQNADDFLVCSSATILFGFIVKSFTGGHILPLFHLLITRGSLWEEVCKRFCTLCTVSCKDSGMSVLYRSQRILLFSFLSCYTFIDPFFYAESSIRKLADLKENLCKVLKHTPDIRERRFIIDILVNMASRDQKSVLDNIAEAPLVLSGNHAADVLYMSSLTSSGKDSREIRGEPVDFNFSPFVQRVNEVLKTGEDWKTSGVVDSELKEILARMTNELDLELELPSQCAAYVCSQLANGIVNKKISQEAAHLYSQQCLLLSRHVIPRVRAIVSRVAVNLKISDSLLQHEEFEKVLVDWSNNCSTQDIC